jgi:CBS domain-containing protein
MQVKEIMTKNPKVIKANEYVADAAKLMSEHNFGCLPVEDNDKLVGMLTDRDITVRVVATNKDPKQTKAQDVMSKDVFYCYETDSLESVLDNFGKNQVNRMPVMNSEKRLVGEIAFADIARIAKNDDNLYTLIGKTKELISKDSMFG